MIIELKSVGKIFPKSQFRLDDISFNIEEGEIVGLIGSNGTGKSTILKMINGLIPYDKGNIYYQGKEVKSFLIISYVRCVKILLIFFKIIIC